MSTSIGGRAPRRPVVTFDLFSALLDSRRGGGAAFEALAVEHGWSTTGEALYDEWDAANKAAQKGCRGWVPWHVLAERALAEAYASLHIDGDVAAGVSALVDSMPRWPLWSDVAASLPSLASRGYRLGLLSNVDDELFQCTQAAALVDHDVAMTSQRLQAYKPAPRIYDEARRALGPMVHVATSARDVRGALEAGITVVRLERPGHDLDPHGPRPEHEAAGLADLIRLLDTLAPT